MMPFLETIIFGNTLFAWLQAAGVSAVMMGTLHLLRKYVIHGLRRFAATTVTSLDDLFVEVLGSTRLITMLSLARARSGRICADATRSDGTHSGPDCRRAPLRAGGSLGKHGHRVFAAQAGHRRRNEGSGCKISGGTDRDSLLRKTRDLLRTARDMNPLNMTIMFWLAQYYALADSFDRAQEQYREVLNIAGNDPGKHAQEIGEAWSQIGMGYVFKKAYPRAVEAFSRAAASGYNNAGLYLQWGLAVLQTSPPEASARERRDTAAECERLFRRCVSIDSRNAQGHFWLGETLLRLRVEGENDQIRKLTADACREFARALALDPTLDDARKEMARYGCR
jgi:hypothetical protein